MQYNVQRKEFSHFPIQFIMFLYYFIGNEIQKITGKFYVPVFFPFLFDREKRVHYKIFVIVVNKTKLF